MVLYITTRLLLPTRLVTLIFQTKRAALRLWRNQPLLLRQQGRRVESILRGLIIRILRQATRSSENERRLAHMRRSIRWARMCKTILIQLGLILTQDITTESDLPMDRLIPTTQMNRLL